MNLLTVLFVIGTYSKIFLYVINNKFLKIKISPFIKYFNEFIKTVFTYIYLLHIMI